MRPLTCTSPLPSALMNPVGTARVGGGTKPGFSQITILGLLSFIGVSLVSELCPNWQLDRTNTISMVVKAVDGLACC